jgi:hypothetical protein
MALPQADFTCSAVIQKVANAVAYLGLALRS